jgi:hypothetical protein
MLDRSSGFRARVGSVVSGRWIDFKKAPEPADDLPGAQPAICRGFHDRYYAQALQYTIDLSDKNAGKQSTRYRNLMAQDQQFDVLGAAVAGQLRPSATSPDPGPSASSL